MAKSCYASSKNKQFILDILKPKVELLSKHINKVRLMEIASGTGEHAGLFLKEMKNLIYQPTEPQVEMHESIENWTSDHDPSNQVLKPIEFDVTTEDFPKFIPREFLDCKTDLLICINMIHISPYRCTESLFRLASNCLSKDGFLYTYGPYRVNNFMVQSNIDFDKSLKERNPEWGIRDLERIKETASAYGLYLDENISMPANNLSLIFRKK